MLKLSDLIYRVPLLAVEGSTDLLAHGVTDDSRQVEPGFVFVALRGQTFDGHQYIEQAVLRGAAAIVAESWPDSREEGPTWIRVRDSAVSLGWMAANWFGNPSTELDLVGVTGTNGKTTVATLLYQLALSLGYPAGLLSTIEVRIGSDQVLPATHTTPDPLTLQAHLRHMVDSGCTHAFMEVSSHACHQKRIAGLEFRGGIFTNLTHDHLDYHGSFANYLAAKKSFFDGLSETAFALTNLDDRNGLVMTQNTRARVRTFSLTQPADYRGRVLEYTLNGSLLEWMGREVYTRLVGRFNASNLTAVWGAALELGWDLDEVLIGLSHLEPATGRFQVLAFEAGFFAVVDYAHTPDALKNILETLHDVKNDSARVLTVVGCGGDRDPLKRPAMGQIAAEASAQVWFTSDNPRFENPDSIVDQMMAGVAPADRHKVIRQIDRKRAIQEALEACRMNDVLLVAGKGHETYQEINGQRHSFDDRQVLLHVYHELYR